MQQIRYLFRNNETDIKDKRDISEVADLIPPLLCPFYLLYLLSNCYFVFLEAITESI